MRVAALERRPDALPVLHVIWYPPHPLVFARDVVLASFSSPRQVGVGPRFAAELGTFLISESSQQEVAPLSLADLAPLLERLEDQDETTTATTSQSLIEYVEKLEESAFAQPRTLLSNFPVVVVSPPADIVADAAPEVEPAQIGVAADLGSALLEESEVLSVDFFQRLRKAGDGGEEFTSRDGQLRASATIGGGESAGEVDDEEEGQKLLPGRTRAVVANRKPERSLESLVFDVTAEPFAEVVDFRPLPVAPVMTAEIRAIVADTGLPRKDSLSSAVKAWLGRAVAYLSDLAHSRGGGATPTCQDLLVTRPIAGAVFELLCLRDGSWPALARGPCDHSDVSSQQPEEAPRDMVPRWSEALLAKDGWTQSTALRFCETFVASPNLRVALRANGMRWKLVRDWALGRGQDSRVGDSCLPEPAFSDKSSQQKNFLKKLEQDATLSGIPVSTGFYAKLLDVIESPPSPAAAPLCADLACLYFPFLLPWNFESARNCQDFEAGQTPRGLIRFCARLRSSLVAAAEGTSVTTIPSRPDLVETLNQNLLELVRDPRLLHTSNHPLLTFLKIPGRDFPQLPLRERFQKLEASLRRSLLAASAGRRATGVLGRAVGGRGDGVACVEEAEGGRSSSPAGAEKKAAGRVEGRTPSPPPRFSVFSPAQPSLMQRVKAACRRKQLAYHEAQRASCRTSADSSSDEEDFVLFPIPGDDSSSFSEQWEDFSAVVRGPGRDQQPAEAGAFPPANRKDDGGGASRIRNDDLQEDHDSLLHDNLFSKLEALRVLCCEDRAAWLGRLLDLIASTSSAAEVGQLPPEGGGASVTDGAGWSGCGEQDDVVEQRAARREKLFPRKNTAGRSMAARIALAAAREVPTNLLMERLEGEGASSGLGRLDADVAEVLVDLLWVRV